MQRFHAGMRLAHRHDAAVERAGGRADRRVDPALLRKSHQVREADRIRHAAMGGERLRQITLSPLSPLVGFVASDRSFQRDLDDATARVEKPEIQSDAAARTGSPTMMTAQSLVLAARAKKASTRRLPCAAPRCRDLCRRAGPKASSPPASCACWQRPAPAPPYG
jgi:hypothetical protein